MDEIIKYSYKKNIKLSAYKGVNLNSLKEETAENLVKYQFQRVTVSIDGATPETYSIYRRNGDFNKVIDNIKLINKYKRKYNSPYPFLTYKSLLFGHMEHEIEHIKFLANELHMDTQFDKNFYEEYSPIKNWDKLKKQLNNRIGNDNWKKYCCSGLFVIPQINWDGTLFGCLSVFNNDYCSIKTHDFGINVFEEGLLKALNNERVLYAKLMLSDLSIEQRDDIPCYYCEIYKYRKENNIPIDPNNVYA